MAQATALGALSKREGDVLAAMADGLSNDGIAHRFHISVKTVETVARSIFQKLGLVEESRGENRRVKAVVMYLECSRLDGGLPIPATPFIGRTAFVVSLHAAFERAHCVTLTGVGGIGKSRIAIEVGRSHQAKGDPVRFVDLSGASGRTSVDAAFFEAFGVTLEAQFERGIARAAENRALLVVIDNAEEVVAPVTERIAGLIRNPHVSVLVTSRVPFRQRFETVVPVPAMSPVDAADLLMNRSDVLLDADDAAILGDAVGRLPLALEMVAARLRSVAPKDLIERLGTLTEILDEGTPDERHGTLAGVLDSTLRSLPPEASRALRLLSAVPGGFDLDLAAVLVGGSNLVATIATLADVSLIEFDRVRRYRILEPIRQLAHSQLLASGEGTHTRERLVTWALDLATGQIGSGAFGQPDHSLLGANRLALEGALQIAVEDGDANRALRIIGSAGGWFATSYPTSWLPLIEKALANADVNEDAALVGAAELTAGLLAAAAHDDRCEGFLQRAETNLRSAGELRKALYAQFWLLTYTGGNEPLYLRAIALANELGDVRAQAALWAARAHHGFIGGMSFVDVEPWFLHGIDLGRRSSKSVTLGALQKLVHHRLEANRPLDEIVPFLDEAEQLVVSAPNIELLSETHWLRGRLFMRIGDTNAARRNFAVAYAKAVPTENATTLAFVTLYAVDALAGVVEPSVLADCLKPVVWYMNNRWGKTHPTLIAKAPQLAFGPTPESSTEELNAAAARVHEMLLVELAKSTQAT